MCLVNETGNEVDIQDFLKKHNLQGQKEITVFKIHPFIYDKKLKFKVGNRLVTRKKPAFHFFLNKNSCPEFLQIFGCPFDTNNLVECKVKVANIKTIGEYTALNTKAFPALTASVFTIVSIRPM